MFHLQAFKIVVTDPDSVFNSLTREVKEIGPDGQEVSFLSVRFCCTFFLLTAKAASYLVCQVTQVAPAITEDVKESLVRNIRRRMTPQPLKIRADIEMKCFQFDGVLHIKVSFFFFLSWMGAYLSCKGLSCLHTF
jgi:translation initiation factor 2 subunit 1